MSDTRALLNRITSFRQRLEQTPNLIPASVALDDPDAARSQTADLLAGSSELLTRSLRALAGAPVNEGPLPVQLTARARRLLEEARGLIAVQKKLTGDAMLAGLMAAALAAPAGTEPDPLVTYTRETVALTDAALRMVQAFPPAAEAQLRMCEGVEAMLRAVRDRLTVAQSAVGARRKDVDRIDGLARRLTDLTAGRAVDFAWFMELGEQLLEEARQAAPLRFLSADPHSTCGYPDGPTVPAPARFVAAHALTVAQVLARVAPQDYEWSNRPLVPVVAGMLMDVGMLRVPAAVLATPGPLGPEERRLIDAHAEAGADLIRAMVPETGPVADAVAAHHERPDGTGYPSSLMGEQVSSLARVLAVCDTYAALACERPHRPASDPRTALTDTLLAAEHGRLDRDFTEYLLALSFHPVGTVVELTDGRVAVVAANHPGRVNLRTTARPVVAVLTDAAGNVLPRPEFLDLAAAERGSVVRVPGAAERTKLLAKHYPELCG
jgi:HD-GYP domain-containing protein (c-di-GMP phosphodiesterase class II)